MGVDCDVVLLRPVDMDDVAEVLAVALGCEHRYEPLGRDSRCHRASGISFSTYPSEDHFSPTGTISIRGPKFNQSVFFMLERKDGIWLSARSTPLWIVAAKRLVDVFGGTVDFNDCDAIECDYEKPKPRYDTMPEDDEPWDFWQRIKHDVAVITDSELDYYEQDACYPTRRSVPNP